MTLFIACLIVYGLDMDPSLYFWACVIWAFHLAAHSS